MEKCPAEVLSNIFILLCCDGGHMAGVLRLVSKRIAAQVKPFRFWSVCVNGPDRIEHLERALVKVPRAQRRVQYLFICDTTGFYICKDGQPVPRQFTSKKSDRDLQKLYNTWDHRHRHQTEMGEDEVDLAVSLVARESADVLDAKRFDAVFGRLMAHISLHLKSLTLLNMNPKCTQWKDHIRTRSMPRLETLGLYHGSSTPAPNVRARLPSLRSVTLGFGGIKFWLYSGWLQYIITSSDSHLESVVFHGLELDPFTRKHIHLMMGGVEQTAPKASPIIPGSFGSSYDSVSAQILTLSMPLRTVELLDVTSRVYNGERSGAKKWLASRVQELRDDGLGNVTISSTSLDYPHLKARWLDMLQYEVMEVRVT